MYGCIPYGLSLAAEVCDSFYASAKGTVNNVF